ncbi:MAG: hypothetical protein WC889_18870 [Myxococcota bacterium]|jgi:hypothetical protein
MKIRSTIASGVMRVAVCLLPALALGLGTCSMENPPPIVDLDTGWVKTDGGIPQDGGVAQCTDKTENVVVVSGVIEYDGEIPAKSELSVAVTKKPPPGMPTCYFTVHAKSFPFPFRMENLEMGTEVYVMAVLKVAGGLPIPDPGVDWYGDLGKTPMILDGDKTGLTIKLELYQKGE